MPPPLERHLLRARDLVDAHYAMPLDVGALARQACVSPAHFSRRFKATFGETPHQYVLTRRMQRAQELLRSTELSVGEVCVEVGYHSLASFTRTFHRVVGRPPAAWRTHAQAEGDALAQVPSCIVRTWLRPASSRFGQPAGRDAG